MFKKLVIVIFFAIGAAGKLTLVYLITRNYLIIFFKPNHALRNKLILLVMSLVDLHLTLQRIVKPPVLLIMNVLYGPI